MQRCASIVSLNDLFHELDETLEYLKSHNGIVDQPINGNDNIIEDAVVTAQAVETAPDTRDLSGCIPSANEIATPTVDVNLAVRFRLIQTIPQNDGAPKRTHNNVPLGPNVQPSKVPKPNPQVSMHTYDYRTNSYDFETEMDTTNPYASLPRQIVKYNVMRDNSSSSDNTSQYNSRWNSSLQVRNKGKGKGKGKSFKKGKRDPEAPFWTIPEFGKAMGDSKIVLCSYDDLVHPNNSFRRKIHLRAAEK
jgi:hypothetical protein